MPTDRLSAALPILILIGLFGVLAPRVGFVLIGIMAAVAWGWM